MNKPVDINQRIPLDILHVALQSYLDGNYSNEYIMEQLRIEYEGENRLKKALRIVNKIIKRNPLVNLLDENREHLLSVIKSRNDRNLILIALLNAAFPFSFDVLKIIGKFFAVQEVINSETIKKNVANIYGGNRATENGIYSVVPMFIEAGLFSRPKVGIYQFDGQLNYSSELSKRIYLESFNHNSSFKRTIQDYQHSDSYFLFVD